MDDCTFNIGVYSIYLYLGYIISSSLDDSEDILQRWNCFIGQVNKLSWTTKLSLYKAYCSSIFGCELWLLYCTTLSQAKHCRIRLVTTA